MLTSGGLVVENPKLRPLEAFAVEIQGQRYIGLRDPQGFSQQPAFVPQQWALLLSMLNGEHSVRDIQLALMRQSGQLLMSDQIQTLLNQLDEALLLDSPRFHLHREQALADFRQQPTRPAAHAGQSYPADPLELRAFLRDLFQSPAGPGHPDPQPLTLNPSNRSLRALIVPHIDLRRGGSVYAYGYKELAEHGDADLLVVFGVAHCGTRDTYTLTTKHFDTPLGAVMTDKEFMHALNARCSRDLFADEFAHKGEHSVEFQTLFLQYLLGDKRDFQIAPLLVGGFHEETESGTPPSERDEFQEFVSALKATVAECGRKVAFVVGVDLSHVGPRFGDPTFSPAFLQMAERQDLTFLQHVERLDPQAVFEHVHRARDRYRICGFPAIYTLLHVVEAQQVKLLKYDQAVDYQAGSAVGFASVAIR